MVIIIYASCGQQFSVKAVGGFNYLTVVKSYKNKLQQLLVTRSGGTVDFINAAFRSQRPRNQLTRPLSKDSLNVLSKETLSAHGPSVCSL